MLTFKEIAQITGGTLVQFKAIHPLLHLVTDSRKIVNAGASLFFAIRGEFHDGHQYLPELYAQGVRQFLVEDSTGLLELNAYPDANFLLVPSSIEALQGLVAYCRRQYTLPVVAITGSNGKTIVKEWLAQLLSVTERVVKSPRSYNSQIGVPLSVWQINETHTVGVFEAGISQPGEMEKLAAVIQPTVGIFTNLGSAHDEGFASQAQKLAEKMKLFAHVKCLVYCRDQVEADEFVREHKLPSFTWSKSHQQADVQVELLPAKHQKTAIQYQFRRKKYGLTLPFTDGASLENALHCLAALLFLGIEPDQMAARFERLLPVAMRLERKEAINGCYVIDDTYNNDVAGLRIALDVLAHQSRQGRKTLILSDLLEAGLEEEALYRQVAQEIEARGVNRVIGIGDIISRHQNLFPAGSAFYLGTDSFLGQLKPETFRQETILVKGARVFQFEKIVAALQQQVHGTVLEVNLDALVHNLNYYRSKVPAQTKIMVMVKAFAYGAGSYEIANLLQFHRADYLAVAYADESGIALRQHGITLPIMVMNPSPDSFLKMEQFGLEPEIYSPDLLHRFLDYFPENSPKTPLIHLKLDTGMHRLGFDAADLEEALEVLAQMPHVRVQSVFSHLAGADEALHNDFTKWQIRQYTQMAARVEEVLGQKVIKHILNSAGIVRFGQEAAFDMVRLGIGLYGIESSGIEQSGLQTVGRLKTTVSQVKQIKAGDTVGYSRKGIADTAKTTATIAIGYADGYDRRFSNGKGEVLLNGQRAPIIGNVCMDMCMVDVTGLDVQAGDEVVIFGEGLPLAELAARIGTIPYELLTNVSTRVKRVFYNE